MSVFRFNKLMVGALAFVFLINFPSHAKGDPPPPLVRAEQSTARTFDDVDFVMQPPAGRPELPVMREKLLMLEDFEGLFPDPSSDWSAFDVNGEVDGEYYWDDDDYKPHSGTHSAWCADGGEDGLDPAVNNYPNKAQSWMEFGPFDLHGYSAAELKFYLWLDSESCCDKIFWGASTNGTNFNGYSRKGQTSGWEQVSLDLTNVPTLGNLTGENKVWIGFTFQSDPAVAFKGAFIDDIELWGYYPPDGVFLPGVFNNIDNSKPAPIFPDDYDPNSQWELAKVEAPEAWGYSKKITSKIAVIDSGVYILDTELDNKIWANWQEVYGVTGKDDDDNADFGTFYKDDFNGWNFIDGDGSTYDDKGHGTEMARIAAAETDNGQGRASLGWYAEVMPLKVGDQLSVKTAYLDDAVRYARKNGTDIVNMSLGTTTAPCPADLQAEITHAYMNGVLVVAAGNGDTFPANCEHVLGVSASDKDDRITNPANGSDYIDTAAPAGSTSGATALVSGLAALVKSSYPDYSADQIAAAILCNAQDIGDQNNRAGYGRINAYLTMRYGAASCAQPPVW